MHSVEEIVKAYKALYPEELVERYQQGERNFEGINLLRAELEHILELRRKSGAILFAPELSLVNPLWADYRYSFESEFEWDSYGRFVPVEYDDLLPARDLAGADLGGINLSQAYLYPVNFRGANLRGAVLRSAKIFDADLSEADLSYADLRRSLLDGTNLRRANLYMARLDRAILTSANMQEANLRRAKLRKAFLTGSNLRRADLSKVHFDRTWLNGSDLRGINLRDIKLENCCVNKVRITASQQLDFLTALGIRLNQ